MFNSVAKLLLLSLLSGIILAGCSPVGISNPAVKTETYAEANNVVAAVGKEVYQPARNEVKIDSKEKILESMESKYKLFKKAWRVYERAVEEEPLDYYLKHAKQAVTGNLLQKGVEFFSGPPQGYVSSIKESLLEATVKSRTSDRAVVSTLWEEETVGDGIHSKDVYQITIKLKKEEQEWFISDLKATLVSQEEIKDFN